MNDDTPRDPLAAQPLTEGEIAGIRKALRSPVGEDSAATGTIRRLLATLDAIPDDLGDAYRRIRELEARPSGDGALEAAWGLIANAGGGDWTTQTQEWQEAAARWREQYPAALATPSSTPDVEGLAAKWEKSADQPAERAMHGDPAATLAAVRTLRSCAAALRDSRS